MSEGTPSKRLPKLVDPRKLVNSATKLSGFLSAADLPRLVEATDSIDNFDVSLSFFHSEEGKRMVEGNINADVRLCCQRCLEPVDLNIVAQVRVVIVWDEAEAVALPRDLDPWIVPGQEEDLHTIVEEEMLLSLPVVAYHDYPCVSAEKWSSESETESPVEEKANPFAVLAGLKGKPSKH